MSGVASAPRDRHGALTRPRSEALTLPARRAVTTRLRRAGFLELFEQLRRRFARPLALGELAASQEVAALALTQLHWSATLRAGLLDVHLRHLLLRPRRRHLVLELLLHLARPRPVAAPLPISH